MSLLEVRQVSRSYGGLCALDGCTLAVEQGSITGLIGPNGSGKTTLFNIITGYVQPDRGSVVYKAQAITGFAPERIFALGIGRTFQMTRIFARLSVLENMHVAVRREKGSGLFRHWSTSQENRRALELLDFVGMVPLQHHLAGQLSYGQKKLLEFAFLLVAEPQLVLLDEPAGGIHPTMIAYLAERIRELHKRGSTFLVVEHNMEFVMGLCDTVNVMHRGVMIATGTPQEVRADPAVLDAYLGA